MCVKRVEVIIAETSATVHWKKCLCT